MTEPVAGLSDGNQGPDSVASPPAPAPPSAPPAELKARLVQGSGLRWDQMWGRSEEWRSAVLCTVDKDLICKALGARDRELGFPRVRTVRFIGSPFALVVELASETYGRTVEDWMRRLRNQLPALESSRWGFGAPAARVPAMGIFPPNERHFDQEEFSRGVESGSASLPREAADDDEDLPGLVMSVLDSVTWTLERMAYADCSRFVFSSPPRHWARWFLPAARAGLSRLVERKRDLLAVVRPVVRWDATGRLHSSKSPAIEWEDGRGRYFWHGVEVPRVFITNPGELRIDQIINDPNQERTRVMIERFGLERFLRESGAVLVHETDRGRLWALEWNPDHPTENGFWDARIRAVEVVCPSTGRRYFLRVPPEIATVDAAVAWTFGMGAADYRPDRQT